MILRLIFLLSYGVHRVLLLLPDSGRLAVAEAAENRDATQSTFA